MHVVMHARIAKVKLKHSYAGNASAVQYASAGEVAMVRGVSMTSSYRSVDRYAWQWYNALQWPEYGQILLSPHF